MTIVISSALALSPTFAVTANNPVIGYENLVSASNIAATTEADGYPASNLANPSTFLKWIGATASPADDEYITITANTVEPIDYVGIAKHNFGTIQATVSLEALDEDASPAQWIEIVEEFIPANDEPLILRFTPTAYTQIRVRIQIGTDAPQAAVIYAGALLVLQRRIYVGHVPVTMGRSAKITNARSESGNFLGRIVLGEKKMTGFTMSNLTPSWYRENFDPFIEASKEKPFFFGWRPSDYPREVGFCWMTNEPQPSNALANGMMQIQLQMTGIA